MNALNAMISSEPSDAALVAATLRGNRDAFGSIVTRYQSLIASLAYSATGSFSQSEDVAQETFVKAWKDLGSLKDPGKLRSWLCAIARHTILDAIRRNHHQPAHDASPLDLSAPLAAADPDAPAENLMRQEEQAIVWRALENIPETYREALVLFYREGQSVERVAAQLDLSTDAVKQRLARGRKFLADEVSSFVETTLVRSAPGKGFKRAALAALPCASTEAATVGIATAKTASKAISFSSFAAAIAAFLPVATLGGLLGLSMGRDSNQSFDRRQAVIRFWRLLAISIGLFVLAPALLMVLLHVASEKLAGTSLIDRYRANIFPAAAFWFGLLYAAVGVGVGLWAWRRHQKRNTSQPKNEQSQLWKKRMVRWVWGGMLGAATILVLFILVLIQEQSNTVKTFVSTEQFEEAVLQNPDANFFLVQYNDGRQQIWLKYIEKGTRYFLFTRADRSSLAFLRERGISYRTSVQGRDFEVFGSPGKLLPFVCVFILSAGVVLLLRLNRPSNKTSPLSG